MKNQDLQSIHTKLIHHMDELQDLQNQTHSQYKEYIEKSKTNKVFGLDSFCYQSRLFDLEFKHLKEQYSFINNRIYCDYYKLYGMLKTFYKDNFKLEPKKRNYIPYKDLEQFKVFEFTDSIYLDQDILDMIKRSLEIIRKKEEEADIPIKRLNIDNYIYNYRFNVEMLKTKVELYEKYLESYHIYHMSFLSNLLEKVLMLFNQNTQPLIGRLENKTVKAETIKTESVNELSTMNETNDLIEIVIKSDNPKILEVPQVPQVPQVTEVTEVTEVIKVVSELVSEVIPEVIPGVPEVPVVTEVVPEVIPEVVSEVVVPAIPEVPVVTEVVPEIVSEIVSEIVTEIVTEVVSEVVPAIPEVIQVVPEVSEVVPAIPEIIPSEVVPEVPPEVPPEVVSEIVSEIATEVVSEVVPEVEVIPEVVPTAPEIISEFLSKVNTVFPDPVPEKKTKKGKKGKK
jgi:hypothetical protein